MDSALVPYLPELLSPLLDALSGLVQRAMGNLPGQTEEPWPPPAGAERAETLFEIVGGTLSLMIVLAALWLLLQRRR